MNKVIQLNNRPVGKPVLDDFKLIEENFPTTKEGEVLLNTIYVSVDPYLRGRMSDSKSYVSSFELNKAIQSAIIAKVIESKHPDFKSEDIVIGNLEWKEYQTSNGKTLTKIDKNTANLTVYLGVLGMTGMAAYLGLTEIGQPKENETIVISGAGGAVGTIVGQIGKLLGCRIIGITGSDEKVELLKSKFKFDDCINYKTNTNLATAIKKSCPDGIDIYFDNVGGKISDAVLSNINKYARLPVCGAISLYNTTEVSVGPRIQPILLTKSATMRGFIVGDFIDKFPKATKQLSTWLNEGKLIYTETIADGFENIPKAFIDLFDGKNIGKMIVKI